MKATRNHVCYVHSNCYYIPPQSEDVDHIRYWTHKLMSSSLFFEQTAPIKVLGLDITDLLNLCLDNVTQVAITPMVCDHEREIWNSENNDMNAANLLDSKSKLDDKKLEESEGQLHCLMAKCYQYVGQAFCGISS